MENSKEESNSKFKSSMKDDPNIVNYFKIFIFIFINNFFFN